MKQEETVILFHPAGFKEFAVLQQKPFKRWPLRLPEQSIFYPVTDERYATEIAEQWDVKQSGFGAVTRFQVKAAFMAQYPIQKVGGAHHTKWWVPAENLEEINDNLVELIDVIRGFQD